jgi:hypothetical protein
VGTQGPAFVEVDVDAGAVLLGAPVEGSWEAVNARNGSR